MALSNIIECGGFYFIHNFDSGNLGHVERVPTELIAPSVNHKTGSMEQPDYEFNLWTRPDCAGTEFENGNRTWFYFGIQASEPLVLVRLNLINLNKQGKMYNQGMAPVTRTLPGKPQWERIRDRPVHSTDDNTFTLSFKFRTVENVKATTFFAFTYPFSFAELQIALNSIDMRMLPLPPPQSPDDIYYYRECLIYSLEGRRVDLLTISSHHGLTTERETRLKNLFPENKPRPQKFQNKKVIFISARVHPGETPSSFVFNGFLNLLLNRSDPVAIQLRKLYVFKMIPFLNPDGVARGHYRTDTRGVNLNRVYLNPSLTEHPTVYASRALIRYYHFGCEKEDNCEDIKLIPSRSTPSLSESAEFIDHKKKRVQNQIDTYKQNRSADFKKEKSKSINTNKSSTTVNKSSFTEPKKDKGVGMSTAANLAEQVCDMRLQEPPSQNEYVRAPSPLQDGGSLLQESVLQSCLGSTVHLSTSEELAPPQGNNPLRPLRDTLKNSISLLMSSSSSVACESSLRLKDSIASHVRMGWCKECRRAVNKLEDTMPGITSMVPGYQAVYREEPMTYRTIEEYREHQKQQVDDMERKRDQELAADNGDHTYFCTNCFRRFTGTESDEEYMCETVPCESTQGANGDARPTSPRGDVTSTLLTQDAPATHPPSPEPPVALPPVKEDKPSRAVKKKPTVPTLPIITKTQYKEPESGLFLYIDLHGHASKKGIFMYGNHFEDVESSVECMLLPRIMSLNSLHFHFSSCNFTERNMYLKDRRDGMSREGSGRVAVLKATGLVRSYTLECNYNTGRLVNVLPPPAREPLAPPPPSSPTPPKYTPHIFEDIRHVRSRIPGVCEEIEPFEVGRSLGASILDVTGSHPNSRLPASEHRSLPALRDWLRAHTRAVTKPATMSRLRPKTSSPTRMPLYVRTRGKTTDERKENAYVGAKTDVEQKRTPAPFLQRSSHEIINLKYAKKNEPSKTPSRTRYLAENEPKPRTLSIKRKNILAIRKPNSSKTQLGVTKPKPRRTADDSENPRSATKVKRSFSRGGRLLRAAGSSSSEELGSWQEAGSWQDAAGTADGAALKRRPLSHASPARLKKIRLKTSL